MSEHVLLIGGSGMLSGSAQQLNEDGFYITVVARDANRLEVLKKTSLYPEKIATVSLDYTNVDQFRRDITQVIQVCPVHKVIAWFHKEGHTSLQHMCDDIAQHQEEEWELIHVKGSSSAHPANNFSLSVPSSCLYKEVILGFKEEQGHRRWLTHSEISDGVYKALHSKQNLLVVGLLEDLK
ncbi:short-chain dehydrogenase [Halobacillus andaensis]|uniref:Short-chain dehydrogenase n=1 Tax=Halobacillus andaensis TaxID=1176239 RepID=A0A917B0V9_HALAA|nr:hypothetical protein [Halobacillus andaensis]MBP2003780.1 hypothetical protein [Halobacillus andaensis]GGF13200.1 short-chain dehydrogenase [Halobacillus andaensis]